MKPAGSPAASQKTGGAQKKPPAAAGGSLKSPPPAPPQAARAGALPAEDSFIPRHIGPSQREMAEMLKAIGVSSLEELMRETLPEEIQAPGQKEQSQKKQAPKSQSQKDQPRKKQSRKPAGQGAAAADPFPPWPPLSEREVLRQARALAGKNKVFKSYIGMGCSPAITPGVISRNILENPCWYTSYTPYQAELAQGRLEALLNFQTMTADLTGMEIANASLLDEGTAAAEALAMLKKAHEEKLEEQWAGRRGKAPPQPPKKFFADRRIFPQTLDVLKTRSKALGWIMETGDFESFQARLSAGQGARTKNKSRKTAGDYFAVILQYPDSRGEVKNIEPFLRAMAARGILSAVISDLLSLTLLKPPGEMGAHAAAGSSQRFGIPMFFGGPHAAFFATKKEHSRLIPGRIAGVSKDRHGRQALRLALQTREQHIRRERATSNICTSQALLAVMAGFYAVYHGPEGLKKIARKINRLTKELYASLQDFAARFGGKMGSQSFFDTVQWRLPAAGLAGAAQKAFWDQKINVGRPRPDTLSWTLSELTEEEDLREIEDILSKALTKTAASDGQKLKKAAAAKAAAAAAARKSAAAGGAASDSSSESLPGIPARLKRTSGFCAHPVFNSFHSETEALRYIKRLEEKEVSLARSMIPLGSCAMKLNATTEMLPVSWEAFADIHPFAPKEQTEGYLLMMRELEEKLCALTGFSRFSFQPNAGSQGEFAGLLAIKRHYERQAEKRAPRREICLIPVSAHGTNPASARMAGLKTVPLLCKKEGGIDEKDLDRKLEIHGSRLACLMLTYPSTYGIFEEGIKGVCEKVHKAGGKVYLDGANMSALLGLCRPQSLGFDVCHLNLHKTFCIPHGGGGPGAGPVGVTEELAPFLPGHFFLNEPAFKGGGFGAVSSHPYGSAGILPISWAYIKLMGREGLRKSAQTAIASANYMAARLSPHCRILFTGRNQRVAHECVLDFRKFKSAGVSVDDVAKRLMDYGFHAPTMSWPVPGTLMAEPSESESKGELDRFCEAVAEIRKELADIEKNPKALSPLKSAPHTIEDALMEKWPFPYSRQKAFYPLPWVKERKFWPPVSRIENSYGDINLFCSCPPVSES